MGYDKEKLLQENMQLKNQLSKFKSDMHNKTQEMSRMESEINEKDRIIEEIMNENNEGDRPQSSKIANSHLVLNLKKQYKDLKKNIERVQQESENIKKNIKSTKLNEALYETKVLNQQIENLKNLYEESSMQTMSIGQNVQDFGIMKEALSKQDYLIENFQEDKQKMLDIISNLNEEIEKHIKIKNDKNEVINKLKKKLKIQYQINEKLTATKENIKMTDEYRKMKNNYDNKLQKFRKDLAYYKDSNTKNEKIVREMKQFMDQRNNSNEIQTMSATMPSRMISTSNPRPTTEDNSEENPKYLLMQSKYIEERKEVEELQKKIEQLNKEISTAKKTTEPQVILQNSFTNPELNNTIIVNEYEYFSDVTMNEFNYILLKNLEANKIDISVLESKILNEDNLDLLREDNNYKKFVKNVSDSICDLLKVKQKKDKSDIHSFIKTFLYNNYIALDSSTPKDFKTKFLSSFANINFYTIEQKEDYNRIICSKLFKQKEELYKIMKYFDEDNSGFITFTTVNKILEELKIKFKKDVQEYFIYAMKDFKDKQSFLKDLKYDNIINILEETNYEPNENEEKENEKEESKNKDNKEEKEKKENKDNTEKEKKEEGDEEEAIEITNEEYLNKVKEIIGRICTVLKKKGKNVEDYFLKIVSKSIKDYKAIQLANLVDVLKNDFDIELNHLEIFCLFTKIKPGDSMDNENEDDVEEIVDYDKLKKEIEQYMKTQTKKEKRILSPNGERETQNKRSTVLSGDTAAAKEAEEEEDPKTIMNEFMKKNKMSFERFIFPIHCMMKLSQKGDKYNRFIDVEFFKHFLFQNNILIKQTDFNKFLNQDKNLLSEDRLNIDFLKFILSGQKGIRDNKINEFMKFKPIQAKIEPYNAVNKKKEEKKERAIEEQSESMRILQKELFEEEDDEL